MFEWIVHRSDFVGAAMSAVAVEEPECDNCGMIDVPLSDGYCAGCICLRCKKNAGELGQSMTDMGFCEPCEAEIYAL